MTIIALITALAGIVSTLLAWRLNPRRRMYAELDNLFNTWNMLCVERDKALLEHDSVLLTQITYQIVTVTTRKEEVLRRLNERSLFDRIADWIGGLRNK